MSRQNDPEDNARHEVLVENTAQEVHKYLEKLFLEKDDFRSRWVWELLQNARDAAPPKGVRVWVVREPERLLFRHNGLPFSRKAIAHLIYHGSTKHDPTQADPIGQYGTGFLTTHLISKSVTVKGKKDDGKSFSFLLDRHGNTADELKLAMDRSWEAFKESLSEDRPESQSEITTEYVYPLDKSKIKVVEDGIQDLIANAPYLLAFNDRIRSLEMTFQGGNIRIEKVDSHQLEDGAFRLKIKESSDDHKRKVRYVGVVERDGTSVAIELATKSKRWCVVEPKDTPRIFVAFPLTATRDFCLPVIVNNDKLKPKEDRDTVYLKGTSEGNPNMSVMEGACDLATRLAILAAAKDWDGAALLGRLGELQPHKWLDVDWMRDLLASRFIEPLRQSDIMLVECGDKRRQPPSKGLIPLPSASATCLDVWDMVKELRDYAPRLPLRAEALIWAENLASWERLLEVQPDDEFEEGFTLTKLCKLVSDWKTVEAVQEQLVESADAIDWLDRLHGLVSKANQERLFDHLRLIPNQNGELKKITGLRRDPGINEDLKCIAEELDLPVRSDLVDSRMNLELFTGLQPKAESEVLATALQKLKERAQRQSADDSFKTINIRFFVWLVRDNQFDKLDGFPVVTRAKTEDGGAVALLVRDSTKPDEIFLAPKSCWPKPARAVDDLFPKRQTLSDEYHDALEDDAAWKEIEKQGYVRLSPLYTTRRRGIPFLHDDEKDKKQDHRSKDLMEISALAFFENNEKSGLDAVSRSKPRAVSLLRFLVDYVLETDSTALDATKAECECGDTHDYYRSAWLVPMLKRRWVPLGNDKQSNATAEAIAQLFEDREEELRHLTKGKGRNLLEALKISLADLSLRAVAKDEETRIALIGSLADIVHAAGHDAERVRLLADEIRESPKLLDQIKESRERRELIRRNQQVGAEVERLLKEALEGCGLKLKPQRVGADVEVAQDHILDQEEVLFLIEDEKTSFLIEIKATYGDAVRMTTAQARMATENKNRFALCIVRLDGPITPDAVRNGCRFIMDIADRIKPVLVEYTKYHTAKMRACTRVGDVELVMTDAQVRFVVDAAVCASGLAFDAAVTDLLNRATNSRARRGREI